MSTRRIGIILGSSRENGNATGLVKWVSASLKKYSDVEVVVVDPRTAPHPLGPLFDPVMPALVQDPTKYASQATRNWSAFVTSCDGIIFVSPQFNWGYPGELKNALDHLYSEWHGKPAALVTYGSRGGGRCAEQLRVVLGGGFKMKLVNKDVLVALPKEYVTGESRVKADDEFLKQFEETLREAVDELYELLKANAPA